MVVLGYRAFDGLRIAPEIHIRNLVHARDRAQRRAALLGQVLAADVGDRVFSERLAGIAALLRAVMHQTVFAHIQVARPGPAAPVAWPCRGQCIPGSG